MALDHIERADHDPWIEHPTAILRIFHALPHPSTADELGRRLSTESVDLARAQPGMLACFAAGREHDTGDLLFLTVWHDKDALRAFTGPDLASAVLPTGYQKLLAHHAVTHRPLLAPSIHD